MESAVKATSWSTWFNNKNYDKIITEAKKVESTVKVASFLKLAPRFYLCYKTSYCESSRDQYKQHEAWDIGPRQVHRQVEVEH